MARAVHKAPQCQYCLVDYAHPLWRTGLVSIFIVVTLLYFPHIILVPIWCSVCNLLRWVDWRLSFDVNILTPCHCKP